MSKTINSQNLMNTPTSDTHQMITSVSTQIVPKIALTLGSVGLIAAAGFFVLSLGNFAKKNQPVDNSKVPSSPVWSTPSQALAAGKIKPGGQILELNLSYDRTRDPILTFSSARQLNGFVQPQDFDSGEYSLQVLDADNTAIATTAFAIPNLVHAPLAEDGADNTGNDILLPAVDFSLTIGWNQKATIAQVLDADGIVIATYPLDNVKKESNQPGFFSIDGQSFKRPKSVRSEPAALFIPAASAQTEPQFFDYVFVGDNYSADQLTTFHSDLNRFINYMLSIEPMKSRASQIVFHYVDNTTDLGCQHDTVITRGINCNDTAVAQAINNAGVPYDRVAVIYNDSEYGGSASVYGIGRYVITYNGTSSNQVFMHEFGHSLGDFVEEYNNYTTEGPIFNAVYYKGINSNHLLTPGNCYSGTPPATEWNGIVGLYDYVPVCYYSNWYEPGISIMKTLGSDLFNVINQGYLNRWLDVYAGPFQDAVAPTVTLTSPAAGSTLSNTVTVTGAATDNTNVTWVNFWVDGTLLNTDYTAPYSFSWNTSIVTSGTHTIQLKAFDAAGNVGQSAATTVTVGNVADTSPPTVSITLPTSGSTVSGTVAVNANANDDIGIAGVQFKLDGGNLGAEDTFAPYSVSWNTATSTAGSHTLTAVARDIAGNTTVSSTVTVTVFIPLSISGVSTSGITTSAATIKWTTNVPSIGTVTLSSGLTRSETTATTSHALPITGLIKGTRYNFTINATSTNNGSATATGSFRTKTK